MAGNKDLNRLKVALVEKGGAAKLSSVSWREPEIQPMAIQTAGMCANDRIEMVYQFITASVGDADENRKTA